MPETLLENDTESVSHATETQPNRQRRLFAMMVVLSVSILHFIVASFYYLFRGTANIDLNQLQQFRLLSALVAESTSLLVLWYVISERGQGWSTIGWNPEWSDIWRGFVLLVAGFLATILPNAFFQTAYRTYSGHYMAPKSLRALLGFSISAVSIAFVVLNPFFEELIVRAYTMSEVMNLGGSRTLAVLVSVSLQMSYHFYQGIVRSIGVAAIFVVFSLYFAKTRRIAPVILAHFCLDALALVKGVS